MTMANKADKSFVWVDLAILKAGGPSKVAKHIGVTQQSVSEWGARNIVPVKRVLDLERLTGIPRHIWRPDIYPVPLPIISNDYILELYGLIAADSHL